MFFNLIHINKMYKIGNHYQQKRTTSRSTRGREKEREREREREREERPLSHYLILTFLSLLLPLQPFSLRSSVRTTSVVLATVTLP